MSLTSILKEKDMRAMFRERFPLPRTRIDSPLLAPPNHEKIQCRRDGV